MQSYILGKSGKLNKSAQETATTGFSKFHSSLSMQISICICWGVQKPLGVYKNSIWLALFWLCKALVSQCTTGSVHRPTERQLWVYKAPTLLTKIIIFFVLLNFLFDFLSRISEQMIDYLPKPNSINNNDQFGFEGLLLFYRIFCIWLQSMNGLFLNLRRICKILRYWLLLIKNRRQ